MRNRRKVVRALALAGALALALPVSAGLLPASAAAAVPVVAVDRVLAWPGLPVTVTGRGFTPGGQVQVRWDGAVLGSVSAGSAGRFSTRVTVPGTAAPGGHWLRAVQGGRSAGTAVRARVQWTQPTVFAAGKSHAVYEHQLSPATVKTARPVYTGDLPDATPPQAGMVLGQGLIMYGTEDGAMAVDAATGKQAWRYRGGEDNPLDGVAYDPATATVYFTGRQPYLFGLDAATGVPRQIAMDLHGGPLSNRLVLDGGLLYFTIGAASPTGKDLVAVDPVRRAFVWRAPITDLSTVGAPVLLDGVLYVAGHDLAAYDAATGKQKWSVPISDNPDESAFQPTAAPGGIVLGTYDTSVRSYDPATGKLQWQTPAFGREATPARNFALAEGRVYANFYDFTVALDQATGEMIWQRPGGAVPPPVYANGLLIGNVNPPDLDYLVATVADARTGELLATYPLRYGVRTQPIVADGSIYLPDEGGIKAVALPEGSGAGG